VAAAQVTEVRTATTEKRRLCWKCRGVADAGGYCFRRGGKERRVPSATVVITNLGCKQC